MSGEPENLQKREGQEMERQLEEYKSNMKIFIHKVEQEVTHLIHNYEIQITQLLRQNENLKRQVQGNRIDQCDMLFKSDGFEPVSPIKRAATSKITHEMSTMYNTPQQFPNIKPMFDLKNNFSLHSHFDDMSKSRFEVEKNRNKQRQQELLQSLESGKNNLDLNTTKMFRILGKEKKIDSEEEQQYGQEAQSARNQSDPLNTSLSSLCSSLDNSFYAKRSRQKNDKKRQKKEKERNQKLERLKESERMRKQQGLKNLLKTMRDNVKAPGNQPKEIVNNSKLLTAGENSPTKFKSKSKVMINPVPVDISKRNRNNTSVSSPKSILKQPSTILTKSLMMGNSAVSFQC